jgi:hypothetical protein
LEQSEAIKREQREREEDRRFIDDSEIADELRAERRAAKRQTSKKTKKAKVKRKRATEKGKRKELFEDEQAPDKVERPPTQIKAEPQVHDSPPVAEAREIVHLVISDDEDDNEANELIFSEDEDLGSGSAKPSASLSLDDDDDDDKPLFSEDDSDREGRDRAQVEKKGPQRKEGLKQPHTEAVMILSSDEESDSQVKPPQALVILNDERPDGDGGNGVDLDCIIEERPVLKREEDEAMKDLKDLKEEEEGEEVEDRVGGDNEDNEWRRVEEEEDELTALLAAEDDSRFALITESLSAETRKEQDMEMRRASRTRLANRAFRCVLECSPVPCLARTQCILASCRDRVEEQSKRKSSELNEVRTTYCRSCA